MASAQLALTLPLPQPVSGPQRVLLTSPEAEAQASQRLAVIEMIQNYQREPERFGRLTLLDGSPVSSFSRMVEFAAESNHVSRCTVFNWLRKNKAGGKAALADKQRKDRGTSRWFEAYPQAKNFAAYLSLGESGLSGLDPYQNFVAQSVSYIHSELIRQSKALGIPQDDLPSYGTVRRFLDQIPASMRIYAQKGKRAYRDLVSPHLTRAVTDVYANQILVGDHAYHDVMLRNDCFSNVEWGTKIRIRITGFDDYRSRKMIGMSWCWEGSNRSLCAAMILPFRTYGPPESVLLDNGKDMQKFAKGAAHYMGESTVAPEHWRQAEIETLEATGFLARTGTAVQFCQPYHGQAKNIERFWGTLHSNWDKLWPTYTSGSPFTRPQITTEAMERHDKLMKRGRADESDLPTASAFIQATRAWIEEYNETPHMGLGNDGGTPNEVFKSCFNPKQKPPIDAATLTLLMGERTVRTVRKCVVHLDKKRYEPVNREGWQALHDLDGSEILLAYEPAAPDVATALTLDGNFLCALQTEELALYAPSDPHTKELISNSMATRRGLEKHTRENLRAISITARAQGALSPLESIATRLQLPANTGLADLITQRTPRPSPNTDDTPSRPATPAEAARQGLKLLEKNQHDRQNG
jgi:hypothetical protein